LNEATTGEATTDVGREELVVGPDFLIFWALKSSILMRCESHVNVAASKGAESIPWRQKIQAQRSSQSGRNVAYIID